MSEHREPGEPTTGAEGDIAPEDFLRAFMQISPEDAAKVRRNSPATRPRRAQEGPTHDDDDGDGDGDGPAED